MDLSVFKRSLCDALVKRGVPTETAQHHVSALIKTFTDDDIAEISAYSSANTTLAVESIADSISEVLIGKDGANPISPEKNNDSPIHDDAVTAQFSKQRPREKSAAVVEPQKRQAAERQPIAKRQAPTKSVAEPPKKQSAPAPEKTDVKREEPVRKAPRKAVSSEQDKEAKKKFWTIFWCVSPLTAILAVIFFAIFGFMYVAVALCIIALVVALIAVISAGAVISLISFIYGIIKLFSVVPEGVYEIGLGFVVMGITMFIGIAIYNIAVRLLPLVFPCIKKLYGYTVIQIKTLYYYLKEECCKL